MEDSNYSYAELLVIQALKNRDFDLIKQIKNGEHPEIPEKCDIHPLIQQWEYPLWISKFNQGSKVFQAKASTYNAGLIHPELGIETGLFIVICEEIKDKQLQTIHSLFRLKTIDDALVSVDEYFNGKVNSRKFKWKQTDYPTKSKDIANGRQHLYINGGNRK